MATKDQYAFFLVLYQEEEHTYEQLENRAKLYLTIVTIFLGGLFLKADDVKKSAALLGMPWSLLILVTLLLSAALFLVVVAMRIRAYEGAADPEEIIEGYGDAPPSDEEFFDDRIADLAVAANRNSIVNNKTASILAWSSYCLLSAVLVLILGLILTFPS